MTCYHLWRNIEILKTLFHSLGCWCFWNSTVPTVLVRREQFQFIYVLRFQLPTSFRLSSPQWHKQWHSFFNEIIYTHKREPLRLCGSCRRIGRNSPADWKLRNTAAFITQISQTLCYSTQHLRCTDSPLRPSEYCSCPRLSQCSHLHLHLHNCAAERRGSGVWMDAL